MELSSSRRIACDEQFVLPRMHRACRDQNMNFLFRQLTGDRNFQHSAASFILELSDVVVIRTGRQEIELNTKTLARMNGDAVDVLIGSLSAGCSMQREGTGEGLGR